MFSATKPTEEGQQKSPSSSSRAAMDFPSDFYNGDFVEDGSFLVLNTDGLSLSPSTPPNVDLEESDEIARNSDIEVLNGEEGYGTPSASITKSQVLGEDPESSVDSSHSHQSMKNEEGSGNVPSSSCTSRVGAAMNSMTNMSVASAASASTDANLMESNEEVNLLMSENKKLAELLADSNEKMKQCITTTEKLKVDHEEYKKKHEASKELINQLRQDNELLKSQLSMMQKDKSSCSDLSESFDKDRELAAKQESLQRHYHTITELNERLKTVLTVNGQLNDQLLVCQKENEEMRAELELLRSEHEVQTSEKAEAERKVQVMAAEIESGRQTIAKFKERHLKYEDDLADARGRIHSLEDVIEEKTKLTDMLRKNLDDNVACLERCNQKLNQKEQEISLLTTKLAAISAEFEGRDRIQALQVQCQTYQADFERVREERDRLVEEKDVLVKEVGTLRQQLQEKREALGNLRIRRARQSSSAEEQSQAAPASRNDNSAANANESLPSPLTALPTVAGQLVSDLSGFVRRELLGWEDQGAAGDGNVTNSGAAGSSETVVEQPKQEAIPPCPICRKQFPSLEKLQRHAANCGIDANEEPDDPFVFP